MELLHASDVRPEPGERVFRHPRGAPLLLFLVLAAPACGAALGGGVAAVRGLPGLAWVLAAPVALIGGALYLIVLHAAAQVAWRAWRPANWRARLSPAGLVLNLRSYQNAHFPDDGPTVARLALPEIARAREVRDVTPAAREDTPLQRRRWLELELAGADTTVLERVLRAERERPGPATRVLGVTSRTRFHHVPVLVHAPGVLRLEWPGRALPRALAAAGVPMDARRDVDLAAVHAGDLDARLAELVRRGDRMAALALARERLGLSPREAKDHVARIGRGAA